jgi:biotin carboxyl carrier protein
MTQITSPVTGSVWQILVAVGAQVSTGDELVIVESMKMEMPIEAPHDGSVLGIAVAEGVQVKEGDLLITLDGQN